MAGSVCTPCLFVTQGPHLSPSQPSSRCLTSILGKSNLQFAGMTISLTISTSSLNLLASDCKQVRLKPACSWRCCCVSFSQKLLCLCSVYWSRVNLRISLFEGFHVGLRIMQTCILRMSILIDCHLYFNLMLIVFAFKSLYQCVSCIGIVHYLTKMEEMLCAYTDAYLYLNFHGERSSPQLYIWWVYSWAPKEMQC